MILDIDDGVPDFAMKAQEPAPARLSLIDWLPRPLIGRWRALRRDRQHRSIARYLDRMNDHTLRDIGLDRTEIRLTARQLAARLQSSPRK